MILIDNIDHADKEWKRADSVPHKSTFVLLYIFLFSNCISSLKLRKELSWP